MPTWLYIPKTIPQKLFGSVESTPPEPSPETHTSFRICMVVRVNPTSHKMAAVAAALLHPLQQQVVSSVLRALQQRLRYFFVSKETSAQMGMFCLVVNHHKSLLGHATVCASMCACMEAPGCTCIHLLMVLNTSPPVPQASS